MQPANVNDLLWEGVFLKDCAMISEALRRGAHVQVQDSCGNTPLHYTAFSEEERTATLLTERGGAIDIANYQWDSPLDIALKVGDLSLLTLFWRINLERSANKIASSDPSLADRVRQLKPPAWGEKGSHSKTNLSALEKWSGQKPQLSSSLDNVKQVYEKAHRSSLGLKEGYALHVGERLARHYEALEEINRPFLIVMGKKRLAPSDPKALKKAIKRKNREQFFFLLKRSQEILSHFETFIKREGYQKPMPHFWSNSPSPSLGESDCFLSERLITLFLVTVGGTIMQKDKLKTFLAPLVTEGKKGVMHLNLLSKEEREETLNHLSFLPLDALTLVGDMEAPPLALGMQLRSLHINGAIGKSHLLIDLIKKAPHCRFTLSSSSLTAQGWYQFSREVPQAIVTLTSGETTSLQKLSLHDAVRSWEPALFFALLSLNKKPNQCDESGATPFHCLVRRSDREGARSMALALLLCGGDYALSDASGKTAIGCAMQTNPDFAHFLKEMRDPIRQMEETPALQSLWGNPEDYYKRRPIVQNLSAQNYLSLYEQAPFSINLATGETLPIDLTKPGLLHQTIHAGEEEVLFFLLSLNPSLEERDSNGKTPLHIAISRASKSPEEGRLFISALLFCGADPDLTDKDKETPLQKAHKRQLTSTVNLLRTLQEEPLALFQESKPFKERFASVAHFEKAKENFLKKHPLVSQFESAPIHTEAEREATLSQLRSSQNQELRYAVERLKRRFDTLTNQTNPLYQHYKEKEQLIKEKEEIAAYSGTASYYEAIEKFLNAKFLGALALESDLVQRESTSQEKEWEALSEGINCGTQILSATTALLTFGLSIPVGELVVGGITACIGKYVEQKGNQKVKDQKEALLSQGASIKSLLAMAELTARRFTQKSQNALRSLSAKEGQDKGQKIAEEIYRVLNDKSLNLNIEKEAEKRIALLIKRVSAA